MSSTELDTIVQKLIIEYLNSLFLSTQIRLSLFFAIITDQVRSLGINRTVSWMAGTHLELPEDEEMSQTKSWHWARKLKVSLLTIICIVTVVLLLFLPEQSPDMELVSVSKDNNYVIDVDKAFAMSQQRSKDIVLEVTIGGSFITQELTSFVSNR